MKRLRPAGLGVSSATVAIVAMYLLVCVIWGTTWIAIKIAVTDTPPLLAAGARFLVAVPFLIGLCWARGVPLLFPKGLRWFGAFVCLNYFCIPYLLLNVGEQYVSSGLTAICFATVSVLIVLMSGPVLGLPPTQGQLLGVLAAFAALALLVARTADLTADGGWGVAAVLAAALMHSFAYVVIKRYGADVHVLTLNTGPMAIAGIGLTAAGLLFEERVAFGLTLESGLATLYLGIVASVVCFLVYFSLLKRLSAVTMSFVFVVFPVIALVISGALEGHPFDLIDLVLTLAVVGAFAITHLLGKKPDVPQPAHGPPRLPTAEQLEVIYEAARTAYPAEACGFMRASGVRVCENQVEALRVSGAVDSDRSIATGYAFGVSDLLELAEGVDDPDDPVTYIFHSHPDVGAYFSEEDQRHAVIEGQPAYPVDHLVVDARADGAHGGRRFAFDPTVGRYVPKERFGDPFPADGLRPKSLAPEVPA